MGRLSNGLLAGIALALTVGLIAGAIFLPWSLCGPCVVLVVILSAGTLRILDWLQKGASERAALGLAATWALMLLVSCTWLLPALEPYRTSRIVGERLAALSLERLAPAVLLSFQEPAIIDTMRRPVHIIQSWPDLYDQLGRHGRVITVALPHELQALRCDPKLELEVRDRLKGFNLSIGHMQQLDFVVIGERASARLARSQEPLIK
jgi:hypothetical protein